MRFGQKKVIIPNMLALRHGSEFGELALYRTEELDLNVCERSEPDADIYLKIREALLRDGTYAFEDDSNFSDEEEELAAAVVSSGPETPKKSGLLLEETKSGFNSPQPSASSRLLRSLSATAKQKSELRLSPLSNSGVKPPEYWKAVLKNDDFCGIKSSTFSDDTPIQARSSRLLDRSSSRVVRNDSDDVENDVAALNGSSSSCRKSKWSKHSSRVRTPLSLPVSEKESLDLKKKLFFPSDEPRTPTFGTPVLEKKRVVSEDKEDVVVAPKQAKLSQDDDFFSQQDQTLETLMTAVESQKSLLFDSETSTADLRALRTQIDLQVAAAPRPLLNSATSSLRGVHPPRGRIADAGDEVEPVLEGKKSSKTSSEVPLAEPSGFNPLEFRLKIPHAEPRSTEVDICDSSKHASLMVPIRRSSVASCSKSRVDEESVVSRVDDVSRDENIQFLQERVGDLGSTGIFSLRPIREDEFPMRARFKDRVSLQDKYVQQKLREEAAEASLRLASERELRKKGFVNPKDLRSLPGGGKKDARRSRSGGQALTRLLKDAPKEVHQTGFSRKNNPKHITTSSSSSSTFGPTDDQSKKNITLSPQNSTTMPAGFYKLQKRMMNAGHDVAPLNQQPLLGGGNGSSYSSKIIGATNETLDKLARRDARQKEMQRKFGKPAKALSQNLMRKKLARVQAPPANGSSGRIESQELTSAYERMVNVYNESLQDIKDPRRHIYGQYQRTKMLEQSGVKQIHLEWLQKIGEIRLFGDIIFLQQKEMRH